MDVGISKRKRRPTQADVARAAGVSQAVVSYVLNDNRSISLSPETRQRVHDAIAQLHYVPNMAARSLRSQRTFTIAASIPDITTPYYPTFIRGIQDVAQSHGYDVLAYNTDGEREIELQALDAARRGRADGIILPPFHLTLDDLLPILSDGTPITLLGRMQTDERATQFPLDTVYVPGEAAAREVVNYLIARGHTHIGMISGLIATPPREERVRGYRRALAEHHLPLEETLIRGGDFTEDGGYAAMRELIALHPRPTAVFAANDLMAMGALLACREAGIRVPEELALAGFDNIPAARLVHPTLTTLDQQANQSGRRAAELLLSRLSGAYAGPNRSESLGFELIVRESA
jgi:LacI family transcriptional regulator